MKRKLLCSFLVLTLLMGVIGTSFAASVSSPPVPPFGEEIAPLTHEEMEDVEGAWGSYVAAAVIGAAMNGAVYWASTPPEERTWRGGVIACATGAMSTLMGKFM